MKSLTEYIQESLRINTKDPDPKGYIFESGDDSILYQLAKNIWNWSVTRSRDRYKRVMKTYKINKEDPRPGLLRWFKDNFPPIPDGSKEIIPRDQWDIPGIIGQTENQIMHKHYDEIAKYHCQHPDKRHDVLVIFECSNKKPYDDVASNRMYLRVFGRYVDFANADYGLIPYAYCELYPYRYDEWDHYNEGEYGSWWYREVSKINFKIFMDAWGYKRAVVVMQNPHPRQFLKEIKEQNLFGWGDKLDFVTDDAFDKEMRDKYRSVFGGGGLLITRMMNLCETKAKTAKLIKKALEEIGGPKKDIEELGEIYHVFNTTSSKDKPKEKLIELGLYSKPSYAEWPYGEKKEKVDESLVYEGMNQHDFSKKLTQLQKELDGLDIDDIKEQKIEKDMGDDIDLVKKPEGLYEKYQWAWPCGKLLYWMKGKKLDTNLQKEYESLRDFMHNQKDWGCINNYFFYYKPITDKLGWKESDVWDKALKIHFIEDEKANIKKDIIWP